MKRFSACVALILAAGSAHAQGVGINTTGAAADTSAILDLSSTAKGFLPPRMTAVQRSAIVLPATGLLIYQTDGTAGLYYNTGTPAAPNWKQVGDAGAGGASQWTTNGANIFYGSGNVGIQRGTPLARLDVLGGNWDVVGGEGDFRIGDGATRLKFGLATTGGGTGSATIMEHGPAGAYNVLSLGTQGNKVLHVNGNTQRIGIGTDAPTAPLGFAAVLGKKISLFPNGANDYGLGISSTRLQIFSDGWAGGDVAIGTDAAGVFTERLAVKNNGALAVSGNTGAAGQVLQSNGSGAAVTWVNPTSNRYGNFYQITATTYLPINGAAAFPGLSQVVNVSTTSRLVINFSIASGSAPCFACPGSSPSVQLLVNSAPHHAYSVSVANGEQETISGTYSFVATPGSYNISFFVNSGAAAIEFGASGQGASLLYIEVIPQ
jgi:hypothetical protein